ncbi:right-handed parallel beta-helix repeat-containing protein [Planctomycetota bacterium]
MMKQLHIIFVSILLSCTGVSALGQSQPNSKERGNSREVDRLLDSEKEVAGVATAFYVSRAGNDSWDGTATEYKGGTTGPWKTLGKVNQQMAMLEGRTVLFRCGDQFEGMLEIKGNNCKFGAYGEGERPVLSGARFLEGDWIPVDGQTNVYKQALSSDIAEVTLLLRENKSLPLGRTPNGDLMTNDAFYDFSTRTMTSVTDPELTDAEELAGAEIVLRKNVWTYAAYQISSIEGTTVNFYNNQRATAKKGDENLEEAGYFFQRHVKTLDVDGEWFYDEKNHILYIYSDTQPGSKSFQYSVNPVVININKAMDIALEGLRIEMAASAGIKVAGSQKIEIKDCEIALCGQTGISVEASTAHIEGNTVSDCLSAGIRTARKGRVVVTRNNVTNIGLIAGRGTGRNGIYLLGGNSEASYNRISNVGYLGIQHLNGRNHVYRNVIDHYNLVTFDGGAIYTHSNQTGSVLEENIIMNGMPNYVGLGKTIISMEEPFSTGIQMDRGTRNLIVRNNTIIFTQINYQDRGIHMNFNSMDNIIIGNTILVKGAGITTLDRDPYDRPPGEASPPSMSGNRYEENVIVSTSTTDVKANYGALTAFSLKETEQCDVETQGVFLNNVCALPFKKDKIINEYQLNCNPGRTPSDNWFDSAAEWNDAREYASGNLEAPVKIDESSAPKDFIQIFYNDSDKPKSFPLSEGDYLDPWCKPISGSVTVAPWRSVILFKANFHR